MRLSKDQARLLALCRVKGVNWYLVAREAQRPDGLDRLWEGQPTEESAEAAAAAKAIVDAGSYLERSVEEIDALVERADAVGARLVTVLDPTYPTNLRLVFNLPPFLFVRGRLEPDDVLSVAVVGTRKPSKEGVLRAARMSRLLALRKVTVISGLARGIDTAAHEAALSVGARTVAVIGTGICRYYPAENRELTDRIAESGAVVSQFWPDAPPATYTFPRRNATMSGIAQGTVVIEASSTSGAKMQARLALEHGKRVFLLRSLVEEHEWARKYAGRRGAVVVDAVDDVLRALQPVEQVRSADERRAQITKQLSLNFA